MKKSFLLFFLVLSLLSFSAYAQDKKVIKQEKAEQQRLAKVFGQDDPDFAVKEIPDKWKNESAVIICQSTSLKFDNDPSLRSVVLYKELQRRRIKLLDKAAVQEFSEFFFASSKEIGIQVIKPNGDVKTIDLKGAVEVSSETKIPAIYRSYSTSSKYQKIAIPDLNPGDIIDYFYQLSSEERMLGNSVSVSEGIISMNHAYPTMKQKMEFDYNRDFRLNFKSLNGAPALEQMPSARSISVVYRLVDQDREKIKEEIWSNVYRSTPSVKYQIIYVRKGYSPTNFHYTNEDMVPKTRINEEEVAVKANNNLLLSDMNFTANLIAKQISGYMKKYHKNVSDPQEYAKKAYYYFRYLFASKSLSLYGFGSYRSEMAVGDYMRDELFVTTMMTVLKKKKINGHLLLCVSKNLGGLEDVISKDEFYWALKVDGGKPLFLFPFSPVSNPGEYRSMFTGRECYELEPNKDKKLVRMFKLKLPDQDHTKNTQKETLELSLDEEMNIASVKRRTVAGGFNKESFNELALFSADYIEQDEGIYEKDKVDYYYSARDQQEAEKKRKAALEEERKKKKDKLKESIEEEFEVESYDDFKLVQDGRIEEKPELIFEERYKLKDLVKAAGNNYIFDIGKLIGGQVKILEGQVERKYDVYMNHPRSFNYDISLTIPEGYRVEGLQKLNMNVRNETGGFESTAVMEGNILKVKVTKFYAHDFEKKESWPKMLEFLNATYDFTESKVLLKRN